MNKIIELKIVNNSDKKVSLSGFLKLNEIELVNSVDFEYSYENNTNAGTGKVIVTGTPEKVSKCKNSYTGEFLHRIL